MEELKYLITGEQVVVIRTLSEGFIVNRVCDADRMAEPIYGSDEFVEKIYDEAPRARMDNTIVQLTEKVETLRGEIEKLNTEKRVVDNSISKARSLNGLDLLIDFLTGDFKYLLTWDNLLIYDSNRYYTSTSTFIVNVFRGEAALYFTDTSSYRSTQGKRVMVFRDAESAEKKRLELLIERIKTRNLYEIEELLRRSDDGLRNLFLTESVQEIYKERERQVRSAQEQDRINKLKQSFLKDKAELIKSGVDVTTLES